MVEVKPFNGINYNSNIFKNIDDLTSPPYDIISNKMQDELYNKNKYNFVRLILGKKYIDDNEKNNTYIRSKEFFEDWISKDILVESNEKSIYPYKIYYNVNNDKKIMNGFFILLKIDKKYQKIRAHEKTLSKPKEDRLNLMRTCKANLEPIQLLYIDENDEINNYIDKKIGNPIFEVNAYDSFKHKLWKLSDKDAIKYVEKFLEDKILFIADGHHRYQTAINYANEMSKNFNVNENSGYQYIMVVLVNMFDKGLSILPTHRLINKKDVDINSTILKLEKYFEINKRDISDKENIERQIFEDISYDNKKKFILYLKDKYYILKLKNLKFMDKFKDKHSKIWRSLDVSILHKLILEEILDINQDNLENHVSYTRNLEEAIEFVNQDNYDFSFIMNPTKIDELKNVAELGEHMPQKSTYFLPKMLSGLVMYKIKN